MSERYIIAQHNSEPAPPEYMYYCGVSVRNKGIAETNLREVAKKEHVMWDDDRSSARQLRSLSGTIDAYISLENLGFENLRIFKITLKYEQVDISEFKEAVKKERVREIINKLEISDASYLQEIGVLDLTHVT